MEGPRSMSPDFEGLVRAELEALLQDTSQRRRGLLIEERVRK
jgi:hypothetical protein